ncbi:TetR/AcrR family transcriptional regulator [Mycobacterium sp. TNTM28]|uniref:TetR/AcrR family transcriptional regulator n=1 Tax=[Mycobacterium] fortunisiensis TaxID=2600579 RepID=A0ABS6KJU6_9MYCO|nr:TetR family transcriptional regulator [[Mycobacterium] fortunisiensis]MBU9763774.1 TetR/AcrR family transcriptional regulator [[Mycobacterium] fortunisiensis]
MFTERVQSRADRRESTRQRVLTSADHLFREQGFGATTIRQIASDAQVSTGTVMAVGDKDALLIAIFDEWIAAVHHERQSESAAGRDRTAGASAVQLVMNVLEPFITYFGRDPKLSREYAAIIVRGDHESEIFRTLGLSLVAEIDQALRESGISPSRAPSGARVVYFTYLGILMSGGGAAAQQSALDQLREVVNFVVSQSGETQ